MIYTIHTKTSAKQIKEEFKNYAEKFGFNIVREYSLTEMLKEKQVFIEKEINIFELCKPTSLEKSLAIPELSVYMPCRISIYQDKEETILVTIGFEQLLKNIYIDDGLTTHMTILFENLRRLMHSWDT